MDPKGAEVQAMAQRMVEALLAVPEGTRHPLRVGVLPYARELLEARAELAASETLRRIDADGMALQREGLAAAESQIAELRAALAASAEDDKRLRYLLWLTHNPDHRNGLYGDDGEMQCNVADCRLDFKRMPATEIDYRMSEIGRRILAAEALVAAEKLIGEVR